MREGWTVQVGDYDEVEREKLMQWKSMSIQERFKAYDLLLEHWRGPDAKRIERTYRIVTVPLPPGQLNSKAD